MAVALIARKVKPCGWSEKSPPQGFLYVLWYNHICKKQSFVRSYFSLQPCSNRATAQKTCPTNTAYSGSLDASDKTNIQLNNRINNLLPYFSIARKKELLSYQNIDRSDNLFIELSNVRLFDISNVRELPASIFADMNEPTPLLITAISYTFPSFSSLTSLVSPLFPCLSPFLFSMLL